MLNCYDWKSLSRAERESVLKRPFRPDTMTNTVSSIIEMIKSKGDEALFAFTQQFDSATLSNLFVSPEEIENASIETEAFKAIEQAISTITAYHKAVKPAMMRIETAPGVVIEKNYRPIEKVGLYIPGGRQTPLVSSLLMQAIPSKIAGCPVRVLATPPDEKGMISPYLLVAARLCGVERILKVGGAQAIAALAYGTESVPKVYKIFGPGNAYVTEAKRLVSYDDSGCAIDMPAGPSEVMIVADDNANADFVAADLLAQAEHGPDSQVLVICDSYDFANRVKASVMKQMNELSRKNIIESALMKSSLIVNACRETSLDIINTYAPEHLIIQRIDGEAWVENIQNSGTIFLGPWAPETLGDYVTGSNHVLPTYGYARNYSGLSTTDFMKALTIQRISEEGILSLGNTARTLANIEGLDAHANAVQLRLQALRSLSCLS